MCPKFHFTLTAISLESERNAFSADVCEWFLVLDWFIHQRGPWEQNIRYIYLPFLQLSIIMWLSHLLTSFSSQGIRYLFPKNRVTSMFIPKVPLWIYIVMWCEFKSRRGKNKNLTAQKSNSNTVWFNLQTYIYNKRIIPCFSMYRITVLHRSQTTMYNYE